MPVSEKSAVDSIRYEVERNTESLVKAVVAARAANGLSGEDIWWLLQLIWITKLRGHVIEDHWRKLKVPALEHLFTKDARISKDLRTSLNGMDLPRSVAKAAAKKTGFVNANRALRKSLKGWCSKHEKVLRSILSVASTLGPNVQDRFDLASEIMRLPPVTTPTGKHSMAASNLLTPLVACLDPKRRFPIINRAKRVKQRLVKLGLVNDSLEDQVRGFINLIGQFGLADAFAVDTMNDYQMDQISRLRKVVKVGTPFGGGTTLSVLDEAEREALQKSATVPYRNRHNKMTNRLQDRLPGCKLYAGTDPDCRYDVLVTNYDRKGRDLLIEAKPDPGPTHINGPSLLYADRRRPVRRGYGKSPEILC